MSATRVFVSYCSEDDDKRKRMVAAMRKASPALQPIVVAARTTPSRLLSDKVMDGIAEADCLVPLLTRSSIHNQWVNQEIGYAQGIGRPIYALVEKSICRNLKGFVHVQQDLPMFCGYPDDPKREASEFKEAYVTLITFLQNQQARSLRASVHPQRVRSGEPYTTTVEFEGNVLNGFFDNLIVHDSSGEKRWNWDPDTFPPGTGRRPLKDTPGVLNGNIFIRKSYRYATAGWPKGKYSVYVRLYSHPKLGDTTRVVVAEDMQRLVIY